MELSKYEPLQKHLAGLDSGRWCASLPDIEKVLGFALPRSARQHPAWWSNSGQDGRHASSWLHVGWRAEDLDLAGERVAFRRVAEPVVLVAPAAAQSPAPQPLAPTSTEHPGTRLGMTWVVLGSVSLDKDGEIVFPLTPSEPAIYRFVIKRPEESRYIGESVNLARRLRHYRKPAATQETNLRLNALLKAAIEARAEVTMSAVLGGAWIEVGGERQEANLKSKVIRCLLENAAILDCSGCVEILNMAD